MDVNDLNSFIKASCNVIYKLTRINFQKEKVALKNILVPSYEIAIVIAVDNFVII